MTRAQRRQFAAIDRLEQFYLRELVEIGEGDSPFDREVLEALECLREWVRPSSEAELEDR